MKRKLQLISLVLFALTGHMAPAIAAAFDLAAIPDNSSAISIVSPSYHEVSAADFDILRQMEERILRSTVRFLIQTWIAKPDDGGYEIYYSEGHGTVKDGRYLVTHNHFGIPLSIRTRAGDPELYSNVTLFNAKGERLFIAPLTDFQIVNEDVETLVFAYKEDGLFEDLGFTSAQFHAWQALPLQAGMEAAQIDWDGSTTRVDWTVIQEVTVEDGVPRLVLADGTMVGASGGGVFWQGIHIANNWRLEERLDATGHVIGGITTVALNSAQVLNTAGNDHLEVS